MTPISSSFTFHSPLLSSRFLLLILSFFFCIFCFSLSLDFLDALSHICKKVCLSVRPSIYPLERHESNNWEMRFLGFVWTKEHEEHEIMPLERQFSDKYASVVRTLSDLFFFLAFYSSFSSFIPSSSASFSLKTILIFHQWLSRVWQGNRCLFISAKTGTTSQRP